MSLDRVQLFVSIAKHLNISQVSRDLRISQPAVSRQLRLLQDELGIALVRKDGRGIALTSAGREFFADASIFVSHLESFKQRYARKNDATVAVAGGPGASTYLLPTIIGRFRRTHPSVSFSLRTGSGAEIERWLTNSEVDIALVTNPVMSSDIEKEVYRVEKRTAFVNRGHAFAGKDFKQFAPSSAIEFVVRLRRGDPMESAAELELKAILPKEIRFKVAMRCDSPESVKEAVREGVGVGILFDGVIRRDIEKGDFEEVIIPGLDAVGRRYLAFRKERYLNAAAKKFLAFLRISMSSGAVSNSTANMSSGRKIPLNSIAKLKALLFLWTTPTIISNGLV